MQATRTLQQRAVANLARATASKQGLLVKAATASLSTSAPSASKQQSRSLSYQVLSQEENLKLLNEQRLKRPGSPHFTIYEPQLGWLSSIANRITGNGLSVGLYAFAISYLVAPGIVSGGFDSASIVNLVSSLPTWAFISSKMVLGLPFWYHNFNGLRHLSWDMGYLLEVKKSWMAGYIVIGTSIAATLATALLL